MSFCMHTSMPCSSWIVCLMDATLVEPSGSTSNTVPSMLRTCSRIAPRSAYVRGQAGAEN